MRDIRRPESSEPLVERLTNPRMSGTGAPVFSTIMDLLIFCAGVGLTTNRRCAVPSTGKAVPYHIFERNQKDGYIFLVALAEKKDATTLAAENDDEIIKIFEEYAAGGLEQIASWLNENATDISGVQALITKIQAQVPIVAPSVQNPSPL